MVVVPKSRVTQYPPRCSLPADVKAAVYTAGARMSGGWDFLLGKHQLHAFSADREDMELALSLGGSKDQLQW